MRHMNHVLDIRLGWGIIVEDGSYQSLQPNVCLTVFAENLQ